MGKTDKYINPTYKKIAKKYVDDGSVIGMFGFTKKDKFSKLWRKMDFYDLRLSNWDINSDWKDGKTYKSIICLRTSGFAKNVLNLLDSFYDRLKTGGVLLVDWSLGSEHYPRDIEGVTWGWSFEGERSYGKYNGKKCFLYSSCLTDDCLKSKPFFDLCYRSSRYGQYRGVKDWAKQIRSEFMSHEIGSNKDILDRFEILHEKNWTPIHKNGRFQLYTIQVLKKR